MLEFLPQLPYQAALTEMLRADALLVMQAANCNEQIPAKVYEYFRARRPIVALTDPDGDTANLLSNSGLDWIAPLNDVAKISSLLQTIVPVLMAKQGTLPYAEAVHSASRLNRSTALAQLLDSVAHRM
jgi:hypothetical protein